MSHPPSAAPPRTNPVSLRLWKLLSTSGPGGGFDDPAGREALEIISERYCGRAARVQQAAVAGEGNGRKKRARRDRAGAHWLGSDAVRRAGLANEAGAAGDEDAPEYVSSDSEGEDDTDEDGDDGDGDGDGDDSRSVTPASSIRPGILSRNHSSTTSIGSAQAATTMTSPVTGATNAKRYFKRDLEAGLVEGSQRFLRAFEKVDEVSLARATPALREHPR